MKRHHWELDVKAEVLEKGGYRRMKGSGPNPDQEVPGHLT